MGGVSCFGVLLKVLSHPCPAPVGPEGPREAAEVPMMLSKGGSAALHAHPIAKARASALAGTQRGVARFKSLRLKPPTPLEHS